MQMLKVTAGIVRKEGLILLARRKKGDALEGCWEFPGGKVKEGESPAECLVRELMEELNIRVQVREHCMDNIHHYPEKTVCLMAWFADYLGGELSLSDHDRVEWVHPSRLMDYKLAPADIPIAQRLHKEG